MTKQIEEALNLPSLEEALSELDIDEELKEEVKIKSHSISDLRSALQNIKLSDLNNDDGDINDLKEKALEAYKDLLDAGFNCDSKHASNFLEPAVQSLSIAMDSENLKLKKKLELYKLKQQDERLDLMRRKIEIEEKRAGLHLEVMDEGSLMVDRNELLERLLRDDGSDK